MYLIQFKCGEKYDEGQILKVSRECARTRQALSETEALAGKLPIEIKDLLSTIDPDDAAQIETLQMKQLQLSLCPARISSLREKIEKLQCDLEAQSEGLYNYCASLFRAAEETLEADVMKANGRFLAESEEERNLKYVIRELPVLKAFRIRGRQYRGHDMVYGIEDRVRFALQVVHEFRTKGGLYSQCAYGGVAGDPQS